MTRNIPQRLERLEVTYRALTLCRRCYGHPVRLTGHDERTGALITESMPADGCPACGRPVRHTRPYVGLNPEKV
jgi:hypothetical protein